MNQKGLLFARQASGLVRELSWWDVLIFVIAAPAASGITKYSVTKAAEYPGANLPLAFLIGIPLYLLIAYLLGVISVTAPRAGGQYVFVSRVLPPWIAFLSSWLYFIGWSFIAGILGYIITGIIGGMIEISGIVGRVNSLQALGRNLQTETWSIWGGVIWVLLFGFLPNALSQSIKGIRNVMRIVFVVPLAATLFAIAYFLVLGSKGVQTAFDSSWGIGIFQAVINSAKELGWSNPVFSWSDTVSSFKVVIWAYLGVELINYASGEVKDRRVSLIRGFTRGVLAVGLLYFLLAFSVYYGFGDFIKAYDFLYDNHRDVLSGILLPITPSIPFYITSVLSSIWLSVVITVSMAFWYVNTIPPIFAANSRIIFSLSMDRVIPDIIPKNPKLPPTIVASVLTTAFAILGIFIGIKMDELGIINAIVLLMLSFTSLAAILLPFSKSQIFEDCPIKDKYFLGIPLLSIVGLGTFILVLIFEFVSIRDVTAAGILVILALVLGGIILWMLLSSYQKRRLRESGRERTEIYSQLPPE